MSHDGSVFDALRQSDGHSNRLCIGSICRQAGIDGCIVFIRPRRRRIPADRHLHIPFASIFALEAWYGPQVMALGAVQLEPCRDRGPFTSFWRWMQLGKTLIKCQIEVFLQGTMDTPVPVTPEPKRDCQVSELATPRWIHAVDG